jgi:hypothetical protein
MSHPKDETRDANRRLAILVALSLAPKYKRPLADVRKSLDDIGYSASLAKLGADAAWLEETGLVEFDRANGVLILTEQGGEVAGGYLDVPGVATPGPGA